MGDPALVADEMLKKWSRNELSKLDAESVGHFLISFGYANAFIENLALKIREGQDFPWSPLVRILCEQNELDGYIIDALITGAVENNELAALAQYQKLRSADPRFETIAANFWKSQKLELQKRKQKIQERIEFMRNEGLTDQERELLFEILAVDPSDAVAISRLQSMATLDARDRIKRSGELLNRDEILRAESARLTPEDSDLLKKLVGRIAKKEKKNPELKIDLALGVFLMGDSAGALSLLENTPKSLARDWLKLEMLLESHHFVDALTWIDQLEAEYSEKAETTPACVYARAKALWGLHQHTTAISLLESLLKSYPDYRSAHALLLEWKEAAG